MVKIKINKIVLLVFFVLFMSNESQAQIWREITPLESTREDVVKVQNGEQSMPDGSSYFNLQEDTIIVKYYQGGCSQLEEKQLRLLPNTVIEMKDILKKDLSTATLLGDYSKYEKLPYINGQSIYVDFNSGFIVVAESSADKPEFVTTLFYIPKRALNLPECLLDKMDTLVQQTVKLSKISKQENKGTYFYDSVFLRDSNFNNLVLKQLDYFSNFLKASEDSKGYIIVYSGRSFTKNGTQFWIEKLKKYLIEEKKNNIENLSYIDGGIRETAMADLFILPDNIAPPEPTPIVFEVNDICNYYKLNQMGLIKRNIKFILKL